MTLNGHLVLSDCKINTGHIIISVFGLSSVLQGSQSSVIHVFSTQPGRRVRLLNTNTNTNREHGLNKSCRFTNRLHKNLLPAALGGCTRSFR